MRVRNFDWGLFFGILVLLAVVSVIVVLMYVNIVGYRSECHSVGGHIITVRSEEVCVDHDGKVIHL